MYGGQAQGLFDKTGMTWTKIEKLDQRKIPQFQELFRLRKLMKLYYIMICTERYLEFKPFFCHPLMFHFKDL